MDHNNSVHVDMGIIKTRLEILVGIVEDIARRMEVTNSSMATRQWVEEQLHLLRILVYGCAGLMLTAVVSGIMSAFFK